MRGAFGLGHRPLSSPPSFALVSTDEGFPAFRSKVMAFCKRDFAPAVGTLTSSTTGDSSEGVSSGWTGGGGGFLENKRRPFVHVPVSRLGGTGKAVLSARN